MGVADAYQFLVDEAAKPYKGWTNGAHYNTSAEWNAGLGVVTKNTGVPTTATPIIVRTSTYTNKPTGTNGFGIDFLAEGVRYYFTVDALSNQKFYKSIW